MGLDGVRKSNGDQLRAVAAVPASQMHGVAEGTLIRQEWMRVSRSQNHFVSTG